MELKVQKHLFETTSAWDIESQLCMLLWINFHQLDWSFHEVSFVEVSPAHKNNCLILISVL